MVNARERASARVWVQALVACSLLAAGCGSPGEVKIGDLAPAMDVALLDGSAWQPDDRPVLVNFWATWCAACKAAIPELRDLAMKDEFAVVGLALDNRSSKVAGFAERQEINYPLALTQGQVFQRFGGIAIPYSVLLGADRQVLGIYRGVVRQEDVMQDWAKAGGSS